MVTHSPDEKQIPVHPLLNKKHTEEEITLLKEYLRMINQIDMDLSQRVVFLLLDSRTNVAFIINVICLLCIFYYAGSAVLNVSLLDVVFTYLACDLLSGLVHIYLDHSKVQFDGTYTDYAKISFQVHHLYPAFQWLMDPDFQPYVMCNAIFPWVNGVALINALTVNLPFMHCACVFTVSFQATHYYAHARTHGKRVPFLVSKLQDVGLIISSKRHQQHHTNYDNSFCILNGFMNPVCDWIMADEEMVTNFIMFMDQNPILWILSTVVFVVLVAAVYATLISMF